MNVDIVVKKGDITREKCDAIVNPANSYGLMGGGVALTIRNVGGVKKKEATEAKAETVKATKALTTTATKLNAAKEKVKVLETAAKK